MYLPLPHTARFPSVAVALLLLSLAPSLAAQQRPVPEWSRGVVWYRILIDRFCNGDSTNDAKAREIFADTSMPWECSKWTGNWYNLSLTETLFNSGFYTNALLRQYGGDLAGVQKKIGYLKQLGVGAVMLSPIFESNSSHKFDVNSFHHVDPHFGPRSPVDTTFVRREDPTNPKSWYFTSADRTFLALLKSLHDSGLKVILDVQFAHVSADFWAFRDVLEKQERSVYAGWFAVDEWDRPETPFTSEFRYRSMWNIPAFPRLYGDSLGYAPALRDYLFAGTRKWMDPNGDGDVSDGIDGWRVELTDELAPVFWDQWTALVRSLNPAALILGETITEPPPGKKRFDLVNSDVFASAAVRMILNRRATPSQFEQDVNAERGGLEFSDITAQINWIDNEETDRIASMCVNRDNPFDAGGNPIKNPRYQIRKPVREDRALQRLLVLLQLTYPGSPMILYGDEAGMWGGSDPDCRKPMLWPEYDHDAECSVLVNGDPARHSVAFDSSVFHYYRSLLALRERNIGLRSGSSRILVMDDRRLVFGFVRQSGANRVYVVMNFSDEAQDCRLSLHDVMEGTKIDAPLQHLTFYADREGLTVTLPPRAGAILIPRM